MSTIKALEKCGYTVGITAILSRQNRLCLARMATLVTAVVALNMPVCSKSYVLYNYNYGRGTNEAVHDHGHQIEIMLEHVDNNMMQNNYIGPWTTYYSNDGSGSSFHRCGWTHEPPNTMKTPAMVSDLYDYYDTRYAWTDCEDWRPDGSGQKPI